jgi:hypothetical protein
MRNLFGLVVALSFVACASPGKQKRFPSSSDGAATRIQFSSASIDAIILADQSAETNCVEGYQGMIGGRGGGAMAHYNTCVTAIPITVSVNDATLKIQNKYQGVYIFTQSGFVSKKPLKASDVDKKNKENVAYLKSYFTDLSSGCMGSQVEMDLTEKGQINIYAGWFMKEACGVKKVASGVGNTVVWTLTSAQNAGAGAMKAVQDAVGTTVKTGDDWRKIAQNTVGETLKNLGQLIKDDKSK